ncbi:MAG: ATP-binding cassette domain-containing protein [Planctomycetota bacterium]
MIEIRNLTKRFGAATAVNDLSFKVQPGEVLGFLGPNGAGKSTTMKMVTGFLSPTSGTVLVNGHDVTTDALAAKALIGYLPEGAPLYPDMTPRSLLAFIADARGIHVKPAPRADRGRHPTSVPRRCARPAPRDAGQGEGFKRRAGLAAAILHDPPVLILDEPTDGLSDPNQKEHVRGAASSARWRAGKVIILSTRHPRRGRGRAHARSSPAASSCSTGCPSTCASARATTARSSPRSRSKVAETVAAAAAPAWPA